MATSYEALETELASQVKEYEVTLMTVQQAIAADGSEELIQAERDLMEVIRATNDSLLELKRERMLHESDNYQSIAETQETDKGISFAGLQPEKAVNAVESEPAGTSGPKVELLDGLLSWSVGDLCTIRYTDGRHYDAELLEILSDSLDKRDCRVSFLHPQDESKKLCQFFRQGKCRFNNSCRSSHGVLVPKSCLKPMETPDLTKLAIGTTVLALESGSGLWRTAELVSHQTSLGKGRELAVIFVETGSKSVVSEAEVRPLPVDESDSESNSEGDVDSVDEEQSLFHLNFPEAALMATSGVQNETINFAVWEQHTRGIASKMMAAMGFRGGHGLGKRSQGRVEPIQVRVSPANLSLDFVFGDDDEQEKGKKRSRGGERRRRQKLARDKKIEDAKSDRQFSTDMFSFINDKLAAVGRAEPAGPAPNKKTGKAASADGGGSGDREGLLDGEKRVRELKEKVAKLEEMVARNKGRDRGVFLAAEKKLMAVRSLLQTEEGEMHKEEKRVSEKERNKKMMKF